ncbi:hypothetical protein FA13DRAFT_1735768 [Coprinellus micaceus]|uniref:Uncharacterized protein n=1 Tax=Coprinellus micaceus TaxID=71717 RepID=A0A4Y7T2D6_COPMI|nr:hypothetical protein FA13DRAFT_1735768 [Coprinellus micaceus]
MPSRSSSSSVAGMPLCASAAEGGAGGAGSAGQGSTSFAAACAALCASRCLRTMSADEISGLRYSASSGSF